MNSKAERFGRERRVRHRQDFLRIQSSGRKARSTHFLMAVTPKREQSAIIAEASGHPRNCSRLGITVTKKVDKRAVQRNKIKRWIRELFRRERRMINIPVDIVIIALTGAAELSFDEVSSEFHFLMKKAGFKRQRSC